MNQTMSSVPGPTPPEHASIMSVCHSCSGKKTPHTLLRLLSGGRAQYRCDKCHRFTKAVKVKTPKGSLPIKKDMERGTGKMRTKDETGYYDTLDEIRASLGYYWKQRGGKSTAWHNLYRQLRASVTVLAKKHKGRPTATAIRDIGTVQAMLAELDKADPDDMDALMALKF